MRSYCSHCRGSQRLGDNVRRFFVTGTLGLDGGTSIVALDLAGSLLFDKTIASEESASSLELESGSGVESVCC